MATSEPYDFIVIGAGIAGASLGWRLAAHGRTLVLEREDHPGYHTTGRSAAQYIASYGPPDARILTLASRPFFDAPPEGFADQPLLRRRAVMTFAAPGDEARLDRHQHDLQALGVEVERIDAATACRRVPILRPERVTGAVIEPDSFDMDVDVIHQGYLRGLRRRGGSLSCRAEVRGATSSRGRWRITTAAGDFEAPVVVNAAGAWCDELAPLFGARPIGLVPKRRSALLFDAPADLAIDDWPLVAAADDSFYFKPDAGRLFGSPANQDPTSAQDVQPEALDIAIAVDRIEANTTVTVRPRRTWAGLRSFVADEEMVGGFDPEVPGLFWCAGQGGYGIQSSPAMSAACAAIIVGEPLPDELLRAGLTVARLSPERLIT